MDGDATRDTLALQALLSEYGHVMDAEDWQGLSRIFTDDVVCDWSAFGLRVTEGLDDLRAYFGSVRHPNAHHVTNVVVEVADDEATVRSKLLVILDDGSVVTGDYVDRALRTPEGWRIRHRVATHRPRHRRRPAPE